MESGGCRASGRLGTSDSKTGERSVVGCRLSVMVVNGHRIRCREAPDHPRLLDFPTFRPLDAPTKEERLSVAGGQRLGSQRDGRKKYDAADSQSWLGGGALAGRRGGVNARRSGSIVQRSQCPVQRNSPAKVAASSKMSATRSSRAVGAWVAAKFMAEGGWGPRMGTGDVVRARRGRRGSRQRCRGSLSGGPGSENCGVRIGGFVIGFRAERRCTNSESCRRPWIWRSGGRGRPAPSGFI